MNDDLGAWTMGAHTTLTRDGAHTLALIIRDYWFDRGYIVRTKIVSEHLRASPDSPVIWFVRSDMFNGLPRSKR
jgi:hypothetical protein